MASTGKPYAERKKLLREVLVMLFFSVQPPDRGPRKPGSGGILVMYSRASTRTGDDEWQREREANDRLRAEDPAAFEAKMLAQLPTSKCCLCGEAFQGYGHNAHPVRDEGVACDACNGAIVLPQRFRKWAP